MRSTLRDAIPSMFHRRLLLLGLTAVVVMAVLTGAATRLTTGRSAAEARAASEGRLQTTQLISTRRGAILDRYGRVLAQDEPGWQVAVHFSVITGEWAATQAKTDARRDRLAWEAMSDGEREQRIRELRTEYQRQVEEMFRTLAEVSGVGRDRVRLRRDRIIRGVHDLQAYLWRVWQQQEEEERGEPVALEEVAQPIGEENAYHVIASDLNEAQRLLIEGFIAEGRQPGDGSGLSVTQRVWREVELRRPTVRRYPMETIRVKLDRSTLPSPLATDEPMELEVSGVGLHLIGMMRETWREDVSLHPFTRRGAEPDLYGYRVGDQMGRSGLELSMEQTLRGGRGIRRVNVDTGAVESETLPVPGENILLSIDILLQAHIQALMSPSFGLMRTQPWHLGPDADPALLGTPLNGAAVVIDIASGDILAAVSMPAAPRSVLQEDPELLWRDPVNQPMVNRALARPYQPGSTLKPLALVAAMSDGVLRDGELVHCAGHLWPNKPLVYRDWYYKLTGLPFGEIDGVEAVARSSNVFFGIMAQRLMDQIAFDRLPWWYDRFGLGQTQGLALSEEAPGALGPGNREIQRSDIEFMAIGQGPVSCTPLQIVTAYARMVSGDMQRRPRLVVVPEQRRDDEAFEPTPPGPSSAAVAMALEGMRQGAATRDGTTHHITHDPSGMHYEPIFNVDGVTVMAKSGTADPGSRWIDLNMDGKVDRPDEIDSAPRDHAWAVVLVQPDGASRPTHAIAVVVEYAGSGGRVAGPVANQIVHALQLHQYLQWPPVR